MATSRQSRTLRSPRLRARIFRSQDGICALCGESMDPAGDWEIDHTEPWRLTHRTNIYELQATHRRCNREKGGRVEFEIRRADLLRNRQRTAIEVIEQRVRRGETTTAIVLPCRYGKSDVIRLTAVKLWATGMACTSLALSPGKNLRDQLGSPDRWTRALRRYKVAMKREPQIATVDRPKAGTRCQFNPNGEAFLSATIQLVQNNMEDFTAWADSERHRTGLPLLVFIDECHSSSDENDWGKIVPALTAAGAHIVLLTATPERADGVRIPGFDFEVADEGDVTIWRTRPHSEKPEFVTVEKLEGRRQKLLLKPDLQVFFSEAWRETAPDRPILCKISRLTFDVRLRPLGLDDETATWLSEVDSPEKVRRYLGRTVRQPEAIEKGCRMMVDSLLARRNLCADFQAIVYCGNDTGPADEQQENKHAEEIRGTLLRIAKELGISLGIRIATSANGGKEIIESFAGSEDKPGSGDVLIVKQMAGMGLDLPWVKTGLDLSATRTFAALVQRLFRPATPCGGAVACDWITPEDVISAAYFKRIVTDQGGEAKASELSVTDSHDKKRQESDPQPPLAADGVRTGNFEDSGGKAAEREQWERVADLISKAPRITAVYTHAELAEVADTLFSMEDTGDGENDPAVTVRDTSISAGALRAKIGRIVKDATTRYLRSRDLPYKGNYGPAVEYVWMLAKKDSDWPVGVEIDASDDLDALHRLKESAERVCARQW
jgi:Type III restriction enzyme, res subunit/HNH endonuclease